MTTLLLDLDGPLADFDRAYFDRCVEQGLDFNVDDLSKTKHRFLTRHQTEAKARQGREMIEGEGWFASLPVTPGALEGVEQLLEADIDLWICSKPLAASPYCLGEKDLWVRKHFPALKERLIVAPDKSMILGDVLLDDAPVQREIPRASWKPVVFKAPFNQHPTSKWRVLPSWTWGEPLNRLFQR